MITSRSNPQIKLIRKLQSKKGRHETGLFLCEGLHIVTEAINEKQPIEFLITSPDLLISDHGKSVVKAAKLAGIEILEVSKELFEDLSKKDGPQGLSVVMRINESDLENAIVKSADLWLALDSIQDPGNLGTILRTMDGIGGAGVILLDQCVDIYDTSAVRASMGSIFSIPVYKSTLREFDSWALKQEIPIIGADGGAEQEFTQTEFIKPMILLMGSEKQGLQAQHKNMCRLLIKIPMVGKMDSLNLSNASAIILYEIFRQTRERSIS